MVRQRLGLMINTVKEVKKDHLVETFTEQGGQ